MNVPAVLLIRMAFSLLRQVGPFLSNLVHAYCVL